MIAEYTINPTDQSSNNVTPILQIYETSQTNHLSVGDMRST
jgi:hypothetical protein